MIIGLIGPMSWAPLARFLPDAISLPEPLIFNFGAELGSKLVELGHEVHVFTLCRNMEGVRHVHGHGVHLHIGSYRKSGWQFTPDMYRVERAALQKMIREFRCDVYHAHWTYEFALPVVTLPVRSVVTLRDNPIKVLWMFRPRTLRLVRLIMAYRVLWRTRHLVTASRYMARYARCWHAYRREISIIPNAVAEYCFSDAAKAQHAGPVVFACASNGFKGCKNIDTLLMAFGELLKTCPVPCELRLYGSPHGKGETTQDWAVRKGLAKNVVFAGKLPHLEMIKDIRQHADVLVHPSREESFGNVIAEAMAIGIPTIVGRSSGAAPEVSGNGEAGLLVNVRRPDSLMEGMRRLAQDVTLRQELGSRAHAIANANYRLDRVVSKHVDLYERIHAENDASEAKFREDMYE